MPKKKKKVKAELTCRYCVTFAASPILYSHNSKNTQTSRQCRHSKQPVSTDDPACKEFEAVKWFYCDFYDHRVTIYMCKNRRLHKTIDYDKCVKCGQKPELDIIYQAMPDRPARVLPNRNPPKSTSNFQPSKTTVRKIVKRQVKPEDKKRKIVRRAVK